VIYHPFFYIPREIEDYYIFIYFIRHVLLFL